MSSCCDSSCCHRVGCRSCLHGDVLHLPYVAVHPTHQLISFRSFFASPPLTLSSLLPLLHTVSSPQRLNCRLSSCGVCGSSGNFIFFVNGAYMIKISKIKLLRSEIYIYHSLTLFLSPSPSPRSLPLSRPSLAALCLV